MDKFRETDLVLFAKLLEGFIRFLSGHKAGFLMRIDMRNTIRGH